MERKENRRRLSLVSLSRYCCTPVNTSVVNRNRNFFFSRFFGRCEDVSYYLLSYRGKISINYHAKGN